MNKIKVSIIIPVYNVEKYLKECLDSIINQTLKDIEIICVNDGSKDNSLSILKEYAQIDSRIFIIDKENGGYASAINTGIDAAQGEFIQIVESDDYCDLNLCYESYNKIKKSDADLVTFNFYFFKNKKTKLCKFLNESDKNANYFNIKTLPYIIEKQAYPWKSLYRASFLKENKIKMLQDGNGAYEDQPWNATILSLATKILHLDKALYYYRLDATGSSTNNGSRKMINYITRKEQTKNILEDYDLYHNSIKEHFINSAIGGCLFFFKRISFEYKEEYYNKMKVFLKSLISDENNYNFIPNKNKKRLLNILNKNYRQYYRFEIFKHNLLNVLSLKGWQ